MRTWKQLVLALATLGVTSGYVSAAMMEKHMKQKHMVDRPALEAGAYINGGAGIDGRHAMRLERSRYNLRLAFTQAYGREYLAGVTVTIRQLGSNEAPVRYEDSGPLLYVKLPAGRYRIRAEYHGKQQEVTVAVGAKGTDRVLSWR